MEILWRILYVCLLVFVSTIILLENRNPVKTVAWVLCVCFLPVVGLLFYFFFGFEIRRVRKINRRIRRKSGSSVIQSPRYLASHDIAVSANNDIEILLSGKAFIAALLCEIASARSIILVQSYVWDDDEAGRVVRDALIEKCRAGVTVKCMYDDVGSWKTSKRFFRPLIEAGAEACSFLPVVFPYLTRKVNYRNHRKVVSIDSHIGFIGGMNFAQRYMSDVWRDTQILIRGEAVADLARSFNHDWMMMGRKQLPHIKVPAQRWGDISCQIVTHDPVLRWHTIEQAFVKSIMQCRQYVYMQTPYFLPTEPLMNALQIVALSGIDVRLMLPERSDSPFVGLASYSFLRDMMEAGVKVYLYKRGFLHAKMIIFDDAVCSIGSTNLDFRSLEHNFEITAFIYDTTTVNNARNIFLADQSHCRRLQLRTWLRRGLYRRFIEQFARLFSPLL